MAKHYVRDAYVQGPTAVYSDSTTVPMSMVIFHMLRLGGAKWLWECDGAIGPYAASANHVVDGNMDAAGVLNWTVVGTALLSKDPSEVMHGTQSLEVVSKAIGDGVQSSALLSMSGPNSITHTTSHYLTASLGYVQVWKNSGYNYPPDLYGGRITVVGCANPGNNGTFPIVNVIGNGEIEYFNPAGVSEFLSGAVTTSYERPYEVVIWAKNDSGVAWDVEVDPGTGSFAVVGAIPSDGVFKAYHFSFWCSGSGNCYVQVTDPNWSTDHTIYIDGISVFRSLYEYLQTNEYGTGGSVTGADTFNKGSAASTYDVGKFLMFWDDAHPENTGCYEIIALSGSDYQLDLRSGTAALTSPSAGLDWRIVDLKRTTLSGRTLDSGDAAFGSPGFGLESPHSSKWRFFCRMYTQPSYSNRTRTFVNWAAPRDEDYDISSGHFYNYGTTTLALSGGYRRYDGGQFIWGGYNTGSTAADSGGRLFLMTDDDLSFFTFFCRPQVSASGIAGLVGMSGADPYHPGEEEFVFFIPRSGSQQVASSLQVGFDGNLDRCTTRGVSFAENEQPIVACCGVLGFGTSTADVLTISNASASPFSGEEHIDPLYILRDKDGDAGWYSERDFTNGVYMGRTNLTDFTTFDSDGFLHFKSGWIWEWNGVAVL